MQKCLSQRSAPIYRRGFPRLQKAKTVRLTELISGVVTGVDKDLLIVACVSKYR